MKLNVRAGSVIMFLGRIHKIIEVDELDFDRKVAIGIPPQSVARRLTLEDKYEIVFIS